MTVQLIPHPGHYTVGTRVLILKGRNKDGATDQRVIMRVTHEPGKFARALAELMSLQRPGERIYVTAGARDVSKAMRLFKERQLANDYAQDPLDFYCHIEARWISCLMAVEAQAEKLWLFDCDDLLAIDETGTALSNLAALGHLPETTVYFYATKNGGHYITPPFNRTLLPDSVQARLQTNPLMLWAY